MKKVYCDICGVETFPDNHLVVPEDLNFAIYSHGVEWDICCCCRDGLNEWFKSKKKKHDDAADAVARVFESYGLTEKMVNERLNKVEVTTAEDMDRVYMEVDD